MHPLHSKFLQPVSDTVRIFYIQKCISDILIWWYRKCTYYIYYIKFLKFHSTIYYIYIYIHIGTQPKRKSFHSIYFLCVAFKYMNAVECILWVGGCNREDLLYTTTSSKCIKAYAPMMAYHTHERQHVGLKVNDIWNVFEVRVCYYCD